MVGLFVWYQKVVEMADKDPSVGLLGYYVISGRKIQPNKKCEEAQVWVKISRNKSERMGNHGYSMLSLNLTFRSDSVTHAVIFNDDFHGKLRFQKQWCQQLRPFQPIQRC